MLKIDHYYRRPAEMIERKIMESVNVLQRGFRKALQYEKKKNDGKQE